MKNFVSNLSRNHPKWLIDAEDLSAWKPPTLSFIGGGIKVFNYMRRSMLFDKADIGKYVVSVVLNHPEEHIFYFLTPELKLKTYGNVDTENFNKAFHVFKTLKYIDLFFSTNKKDLLANYRMIYFDVWKITEEENEILLKHHRSKRINNFTFECSKCKTTNKISDVDYVEYRNYSFDEDTIFECKKCTKSKHNITVSFLDV